MASSRRPRRVQGVPTEFSLRSAEFYVAFHGVCETFSLRLRGALGVRTALPRRSSTALAACRQNRNKVSSHGRTQSILRLCALLRPRLCRTRRAAPAAICNCCTCIHTSSKPACCSTNILKEICGRIHVCGSHLNSGLFAFVIKFLFIFFSVFIIRTP